MQIAAAFDAVGQSGYVSLCGWTRGREVFAQGIQGFQEADGTRMSQEFKDQWLVNGIYNNLLMNGRYWGYKLTYEPSTNFRRWFEHFLFLGKDVPILAKIFEMG